MRSIDARRRKQFDSVKSDSVLTLKSQPEAKLVREKRIVVSSGEPVNRQKAISVLYLKEIVEFAYYTIRTPLDNIVAWARLCYCVKNDVSNEFASEMEPGFSDSRRDPKAQRALARADRNKIDFFLQRYQCMPG